MKSIGALIFVTAILLGCIGKADDGLLFEGNSMLPSIRDGEKIRLERFGRDSEFEIKHGDIIVFLYPEDTSKFYIKRLIALPGETVEIREGKVILDGEELAESYVEAKRNMTRISKPAIKVGENEYYVLGDNRDVSSDSRIWGLVPRKNILARVLDK